VTKKTIKEVIRAAGVLLLLACALFDWLLVSTVLTYRANHGPLGWTFAHNVIAIPIVAVHLLGVWLYRRGKPENVRKA